MSPGDLLDRIAGCEVGLARASDPAERVRLGRALAALTAARDRALPPSDELDGLAALLREAHETLRDLDADLRGCEARGDVGPAFVALARAQLHVGAERAELRRSIDRLLGASGGGLPDIG